MNFQAWLEEFYPTDAKDYEDKTDRECLEHSILKWEGFLPKNMEKHDISYNDISDWMHGTCALCEKYSVCDSSYHESLETKSCPIVRATGKTCDSPWHIFREENDPWPMIKLLQKTVDFLDSEEKKGE